LCHGIWAFGRGARCPSTGTVLLGELLKQAEDALCSSPRVLPGTVEQAQISCPGPRGQAPKSWAPRVFS
jgi:hypothetical protein